MKLSPGPFYPLLLLTALCCGCGGSDDTLLGSNPSSIAPPAPSPSPNLQARLDEAFLNDSASALQIAPRFHLNPRVVGSPIKGKGGPLTIPVSQLETDYETFFGSLNSSLGVTLQTPQVAADIQFIASQPGTGFFNLLQKPILNNPLGITSVSFQPLEYDTTVPLPTGDQSFHVSGGLLMPLGISRSQLKGVVVYFHGTTFSKAQVPSEYDGNGETELMAEVFASQGYVVVMPDYVGQGVDWETVHPYVLYPKVSAQTAADMLTAVKPLLTSQYPQQGGTPALKLFSVGYSEGGSYSLWFNQYLSSNPSRLDPFYRLTHSVGCEGAYSTSQVTFNYLFTDVSKGEGNPFNIQSQSIVNAVKAILSADAFLSYATYSVGSQFEAVFNANFFTMNATFPVRQTECNVNDQHLTIAQAFAQPATNIGNQILSSALGKAANGHTYPTRLELLLATHNSVRSLVSATLLQPEPFQALRDVLASADLDLSAVADGGVSIVSLDQDSVVVPNNFDDLLTRFPNKIRSSYKIDHTRLQVLSPFSAKVGQAVFTPADHMQAPTYEFLYALNLFNQF
jgi:hypothetical protein